jgi:hypothetical protein
LGKKFYNTLKTGPNFFLRHFKKKIILNFVKFVATRKDMATNYFSSLSFVAVFGSGIRVLGSGMVNNQDPEIRDNYPGSGIRDEHPGSATLPSTQLFCGSSLAILPVMSYEALILIVLVQDG